MQNRQITGNSSFDEKTLFYLSELSKLYPTIDSALGKITNLKAALSLPKGTVHVISDIHGEYKKLKHIINNASGNIKPLVEAMFKKRLSQSEILELLNFIYYPRESYLAKEKSLVESLEKKNFLLKILGAEFEVMKALSRRYILEDVDKVFPADYKNMLREVLTLSFREESDRLESALDFTKIIVEEFVNQKKELDLLRIVARTIRNLSVCELVVAGDLGDRGSRVDKVIDYLMHQPNVTMTWGNHDASWFGACLGSEVCIATVLRISLRYRRLSQLEEGYGIPIAPLEKLANTIYKDDPAVRFECKGTGLREPLLMSRMQKAIAVILFKLEGQVVNRNPHFKLSHRNLLHKINKNSAEVELYGKNYKMLDMNFPTIDWENPYELSTEEKSCMERLKKSFIESPIMWNQMRYVASRGAMYVIRDKHLIFHACVPVDEAGNFLDFEVDGEPRKGKALFDSLGIVFQRALRNQQEKDFDLLWYLWSGPLSPWFGKDKMATFENYFIAEKETHKETKNPYFKLIHNKEFCVKILKEFGIDDENGLIVNGHVPVKIEEGESPLKDSKLAVTIDGAFSEAYGDKGYTLVLDSDKTYLALHHHFESVSEAIKTGADIIPLIQDIRKFNNRRLVCETEKGEEIRQNIQALELLIRAYRENVIRERLSY